MFSLLAKFASVTLDWAKQESPKVKIKEDISSNRDKQIEKRFTGNVTSINVYEEYGIIDCAVYFNFNVIYAHQQVSVGDSVLVHAVKKGLNQAWSASYVEVQTNIGSRYKMGDSTKQKSPVLSSEQEKGNKMLSSAPDRVRVEQIEQTVSEFNRTIGKMNGGFEFHVEDGETDFLPEVGDILTATVEYSESGKKVTSWTPKEIKCIEGQITACENNCGVINNEVMFFRRSCRQKINLYVGLKVSAMISLSEQGLFKWRAFSLCSSTNGEENEQRKPMVTSSDFIYITDPLNFDNLCLGQQNKLSVAIQNLTPSTVTLCCCYFQNERGTFYLEKNIAFLTIPGLGATKISVHCRTESLGQHEDILLLEFPDFIVKRNVTANIVDPMQHLLRPIAPFSGKNKNCPNQLDSDDLVIIPGRKPFKPIQQFSNKLPPSNIPKYLMKAVEYRQDLKHVAPCIFQKLCMRNYIKKFSTLLHLEEIQVRLDMRKFDLSDVILQKKGEYLSLKVEGLAEGRPSLVVGDKAILVPPHTQTSFAFEGCIHEVRLDEVLLKFIDSFHSTYGGESFDVRFELNRTNFRRLHQCVHHVAENHDYAIFPSRLVLKKPLVNFSINVAGGVNIIKKQKRDLDLEISSIQWKNIKLNWKQKEAVKHILRCQCRPLPYIIFGPPGTGKTVTLVESVLQVYENIPTSKLIVCTPSNSAADLVAQRIIESNLISKNELVRLNSYQRCIESIPELIRPYSLDKDSLEYISQYRIVISTCSTAGALYSIGLCNDFFTHVFIDEAGQLMEPESNIAVGFIDSQTCGQVVMAGDPQQLGPVLRSSHTQTYGLQVSFLERLMNTALYARNEGKYGQYGGYNPLLVTMLEESYRSHPNILRFPSETFYFSRIICCFPTDRMMDLAQWAELPSKGFPVIFHGIKGEEFREQNSPSWFNPAEVVQVSMYLRKLYDLGLTPNDVGIIAPYKKQVEKIRFMLSALNLEFCKIGSVEEFQGQERRAIIISTVRSSDQFVNCDILYNLGFISNPKRLNVAITRSQELLIVVGNPHVLSKDFYWHSFVRYCVINMCYIGCELPLTFCQNRILIAL